MKRAHSPWITLEKVHDPITVSCLRIMSRLTSIVTLPPSPTKHTVPQVRVARMAAARAAAVRSVRSWGTACFVGERGQVTLDVSPDLLRRQITLVGSWTFSTQGQADCAEFVADQGIAVDRLFTHRWRLDQAEEAYRLFDTQSTGKGVILPS